MKLSILAGATSQSINIFIADSSSTTGAGLTGLAYNSGSLTAYYSHAGANATATSITLATLATITTAWSSGGFKEIDATNMPGWYRFDIPNAVLAASKGRSVAIHLKGATNMAPLPIEIELTGWDNQDGVHGGMTALPNAAAEASGGLVTRGTSTGQISVSAGGVAISTAGRDAIWDHLLTEIAVSGSIGKLIKDNVDATISSRSTFAGGAVASVTAGVTVTTNNDKTGYSLTQAFPSNFSSLGINASGHISRVALCDTITTYTGNTVQTGDSYARIGSAGAGLTSIGDTRLANLDAAITSRLASASYTSPPSAATNAAAVRTELTTELGRIDVATSSRLAGASYAASPSTSDIVTAIKAFEVETGVSFLQFTQYVGAALAGKVTGAGSGTEVFKNIGGNTTRITYTTDADGNRSAVAFS